MRHAKDLSSGTQSVPARRVANAMTVDVEEYFHVSAMESRIPRSTWDRWPSRLEESNEKILELFGRQEILGTFFILGWVAERYPAMVRSIAEAGHEIASHGYEHRRVHQDTPENFKRDVFYTKQLLEDVTGVQVRGYRAASFSIGPETPWAFEKLQEAGYCYSSSTCPIRHDLYGDPSGERFAHRPIPGSSFLEIPISTVELYRRRFPSGGGGFFRLLPMSYSSWALNRINRFENQPGVFYFHPWEIDPGQPRVRGLSARSRFRHYTNLNRMYGKLQRICRGFTWDRMDRIFLQ